MKDIYIYMCVCVINSYIITQSIYIYIYIYICVCVCVCVCNQFIYNNTVWASINLPRTPPTLTNHTHLFSAEEVRLKMTDQVFSHQVRPISTNRTSHKAIEKKSLSRSGAGSFVLSKEPFVQFLRKTSRISASLVVFLTAFWGFWPTVKFLISWLNLLLLSITTQFLNPFSDKLRQEFGRRSQDPVLRIYRHLVAIFLFIYFFFFFFFFLME